MDELNNQSVPGDEVKRAQHLAELSKNKLTGEVRPAEEFIAEATKQVVVNDNNPQIAKAAKPVIKPR